ncbi:MAG: glycoside hydrolase family 16 protein [Pirellulaceae bacterium]|nr:glycoside hydrolase family 16 protein [Pirellulaceae bacterium]
MRLPFLKNGSRKIRSIRGLQVESLELRQLLAVDVIANGDFSDDLSQWVNESSLPATVSVEQVGGDSRAILRPAQEATARISQQISVDGGTDYQLTGQIFSEEGAYGYLGVKGFDGKWSDVNVGDRHSGSYTVSFTTATDAQFVTVYAQAYKQQTGLIGVDTLRLLRPVNDPPVNDPVDNAVSNGDFSQDLIGWVDDSSLSASASITEVSGNPQLRLQPTSEGTASISQRVSVEGSTDYRLSGQIFSEEGVYGYFGVKGFDGKWSEVTVGDNVSGEYSLSFTTAADTQFVTLFAQAYKQQIGSVGVDAIYLVPAELAPPTDPPVSDPPVSDPPVLGPDSAGNWVQGGTFTGSIHSAWSTVGSVAVVSGMDGESSLELLPAATESSRAIQIIEGLRPQTLYTFSARVRTEGESVWASFGVDQGTQLPKTNAAQGDQWQEKRFVFYTATDSTEVRLFLEAYQGQTGNVYFDDLRIVEGVLPLPVPSEGGEWPIPPALPVLVSAGDEMVANADFAAGLEQWVSDHAVWQTDDGNTTVTLTATAEESARAVQDIPYALAPNTTYTLTAMASVEGSGATIAVRDRADLNADLQLFSGSDEHVSISFTTGGSYRHVRVVLEQYKGSDGSLSVQNVSLRAQGGEWLDTPQPDQEPTTEILYDDFGDGLDLESWLVVDKAWGGDNGGLVPENVEIKDGLLLLHAHGDDYEGEVVGHNDRTTRVGAGIATRDYYASGRYEVRARIPEVTGAASAFWTFHYVEHFPSEEAYWEEPSRVRNSEIDWEFPTSLQNGSSHDPISFDNARVNSWGGKLGGEGAHHPGRVEVVNDGQFHTYGIDWHSGGDGELPRVIWTIDGDEVYRHEGALFGQDNIPTQASRFWLGIWFPSAGYKEQLEGVYVDRVGWAGDPDFSEATLEIDWVRITPFNEVNDRWEPETWPNGWYALPHEYPGWGLSDKANADEDDLLATDHALADWSADGPLVD